MADDFDAWPQSELSPGELLAALTELLRSSRSVTELSAERVGTALRITPEITGDDAYRYSARFTSQWRYLLGYEGNLRPSAVFMLDLFDRNGRDEADLGDVSAFDVDGLATGLAGAAFERDPRYAEHGMFVGYEFSRPGMTIMVDTRRESGDRDRNQHECILGIRVS